MKLWDPRAPASTAWRAVAAPGAAARLSTEDGPAGTALRLDVTLAGHGSWALARREGALVLPAHYVVRLAVRGTLPPTELQVKLVDPSGANVWWWRLRPHVFTTDVSRLVLRRAALLFAWGPASGGEPRALGAVEVALAADDARSGTCWIDELCVEERPVAAGPLAITSVRASSALPAHPAANVCDPGGGTWRPAPGDATPWLVVDLGASREWGGLVVRAAGRRGAPAMRLAASEDGTHWTTLADAAPSPLARQWLRTADGDGRFARLEFPDGAGAGIAHVQPVPLELTVSPARHAAAVAAAAPRGRFPRHLLGEQGYWAVLGVDGDARTALLGEDGALEVDAEAFTLEPFLWSEGRLLTWADAERTLALADDHLPLPSVEWRAGGLRLVVSACAVGRPGAVTLLARYAVTRTADAPAAVRLYVAIRPFQVNPSWQSLHLVGGIAPITRIVRTWRGVRVNDRLEVVPLRAPDAFGAAAFDEGLRGLEAGRPPAGEQVDDPVGFAEGALGFDLALVGGGTELVGVAVPLDDAAVRLPRAPHARARWLEQHFAKARRHWRRRLSVVPVTLPPAAAPFADTLRASLAWILVNRDGPRIQPGPRCYRRSWIRDGSLTGTALVEMGLADEAREFLRWYAPFQYDDGRVPCAVDRRGVDPVVEHDSHGQLVWGIVEVFRLTGDRAFLESLWPRVLRAAEALVALRAERTTAAYRGRASYGLLPESISHEGYASRPVHSYWDDFFAVRALADAAWAAALLGDTATASRLDAEAAAMRGDLARSIAQTMAEHGLAVLPGSVELGDFDPTSSAIAVDPCGAEALLPPGALAATFERYWAEVEARRRGDAANEAYTPYEVRNASALLQLGWPERALTLLAWLIEDQRPPAWRQWPEIAWRDPRAPRFLGDLPHGWVASSFVRALRRLLAWERRDAGVLVIGAGVPRAWTEDPGVVLRALPTHFGPLDAAIRATSPDEVVVRLGGAARPPGGFVVMSPGRRALATVLVDGRPHASAARDAVAVAAGPVEIRLRY
ncbi:MAG TPA: discoidin domain-containing protein [Candidatus Limnocylindria bacterium]|nr:discoidin domain-containing protein [Candidatus Limnocylindria bacterium]